MSIETLFETYAGAWEQRDADAIAALHTPDSTYHLHAAQEPAFGRDAVRDAFAELFEQWPDMAFELVSVRFGEDFWAVEWKVRTSAYEADLADIVTVEDGLVKSKQSYIDGLAVLSALQAAETPAPQAA